MAERVVHCMKQPYDVYIGRPNPKVQCAPCDCVWGNPFKIGPGETRAAVIRHYEQWLLSQPDLVARAQRELRGKVLACWCAPLGCHGDVLARVANAEPPPGGAAAVHLTFYYPAV